jgi:hypothetical protein
MRYIELNLTTGKPIYLNVELIKYFYEVCDSEGNILNTKIGTGDDGFFVIETPKEIHTKIVSGSPLKIK